MTPSALPARWSVPDDAAVRAILALVAVARSVDGVEPLSGHVLAALSDAQILSIEQDGRFAGIAVTTAEDPAELLVHPDFRGRGIGTALLDAALRRRGRVWAHGDLPAARALAAARNLEAVRMLLQLRRPLADLPGAVAATGETPAAETPTGETPAAETPAAETPAAETPAPDAPGVQLPPGVRIRTFSPADDVEEFLAVNGRAFDWHPEQGRLDAAGLTHEMDQPWFDPAGFFLAVTGDGAHERILGFHWTKVHEVDPTPVQPGSGDRPPADPGPVGEVYVLGVDPLSPIRRLGTPLTIAGLRYLSQRGMRTVMLYVEGDNPAALQLYRRLGFAEWATDVVYAVPAAGLAG